MNELASKFAWHTSAGRVARGGEHPLDAIPTEVALATETGSLTWGHIMVACFLNCQDEEQARARGVEIIGAVRGCLHAWGVTDV